MKRCKVLIAPHNDDEALFTAYTIMREKPLVVIVFDGYQHQRKFGVKITTRQNESLKAMDLLDIDVVFLHLSDEGTTEEELAKVLSQFSGRIYAPALGANPQHNLVSKVCDKLFKYVTHYCTYDKELLQKGKTEIVPTKAEMKLKNKILKCYKSQLKINPHHFDAVKNKSEYQD